MALVAVVLSLTALLWMTPRPAVAYDLCGNVSGQFVCGARWNSHQFAWHDSTGWTGANATAVQSAGPKWNSVADTLTLNYDSSPTGPYQAYVYRHNLDSFMLYVPGATWSYGATGDVYNIVGTESALNTTWTWYTDGTMNESLKRADVLTVTLHEMGHWMKLGHPCSSQPGAVVCP